MILLTAAQKGRAASTVGQLVQFFLAGHVEAKRKGSIAKSFNVNHTTIMRMVAAAERAL